MYAFLANQHRAWGRDFSHWLASFKNSVDEVSIFVVWAYTKKGTRPHPTSPKRWSNNYKCSWEHKLFSKKAEYKSQK